MFYMIAEGNNVYFPIWGIKVDKIFSHQWHKL